MFVNFVNKTCLIDVNLYTTRISLLLEWHKMFPEGFGYRF